MNHILRIFTFTMWLCVFVNCPVLAETIPNPYYNVVYHHVTYYQKQPEASNWITKCILHYSQYYNVDPLLVTALFTQESHFSMESISPTGAIGIAQIQPGTAQALGIDPYDPEQNIAGGIKYLAQQLQRFSYMGDLTATYAIAAYNAGPGSVEKYGGVPPYNETCQHVNNICDIYVKLCSML